MKIGLLDTTIIGQPGSMRRYREQLEACLRDHGGGSVEVSTEYLGCEKQQLDKVPARIRMWWHHRHVWSRARKSNLQEYDAVHLLDGSFGYVCSAVKHPNVVSTVHDVIPRLQMDGQFPGAPPVGRGARWLINRSLAGIQNAVLAVADSQSTADDLKQFGVSPRHGIQVVPLAIEPELFTIVPESSAVKLPTQQPYLLHLGNNGFYKNRIGAIEVMGRLAETTQLHLVMAGPPVTDSLQSLIEQFNLEKRVHFCDFPSQTELASLYQNASSLIFPSLYEGFGWPPLEAMAACCPVVCSDAGSLPEVAGDAGVVVPSTDYDAMAEACRCIAEDGKFRAELIERGQRQIEKFSTQLLAEKMLDAYQLATKH